MDNTHAPITSPLALLVVALFLLNCALIADMALSGGERVQYILGEVGQLFVRAQS